MNNDMDLGPLLPEIILAATAVAGLLLGSFLPKDRQWLVRVVAALACVAGLVWTVGGETGPVFAATYTVDAATDATRVIVLVSVLLVLAMTRIGGHARETEFVVLLLLAALGAVLLASAGDLLLLAAAYLLASVPLYALTGFAKDAPGTEATLKFYLLGALLGTTMLFGVMLVSGVGTGSDYPTLRHALPDAPTEAVAVGAVAVLAGLLFKAGAVPGHFWVPDVTEGTMPAVGAIVTTIPKIGAVVATYRFVTTVPLDWSLLVAIIAAATMTLGNLAAFFQQNVRRLLAYSTISQVGYLLMAVAAGHALPSLLLYLAAYAVTNLGAFAVVCALPKADTIDDYTGLARHRPWLVACLAVCLLGLVGTPPTGVFAGKLTVFTATLDAGLGWLAVVAAVNTVASLFYYLRWLMPTLRARTGTTRVAGGVTAYVAAPASVAIGLLAGPILAAWS
ncbi:NADH-quinone oxidoreductase subunit N [Actinophytocola oryzae]|uniref:NADH-quinone oxidoreductase subunit N n=1 Tax=Actinophytocola oryzae TaxID=502181 RepID=A0A4R7W482_9PSEU|nr:NADH-quinone oxidoreductase subunit N [Actinophytocola oryzae]TDV57312.1 NADH-quinone oxidoreductase subunit N [Actinophytocola oryzae]